MSETKIGAFGHIRTRTRPWQRTGSSFMEGNPPHGRPEHGLMSVSTIWADAQHQIPLAFTDEDGCVAVILGEVDAAWAEAEAALSEGWKIDRLDLGAWGSWWAYAGRGSDRIHGEGDTPAAALRALAAKLLDKETG